MTEAISAVVDKLYIDLEGRAIMVYLDMKRIEMMEEKKLEKYIPMFRRYVENYMARNGKEKITEEEAEILARNFVNRIK